MYIPFDPTEWNIHTLNTSLLQWCKTSAAICHQRGTYLFHSIFPMLGLYNLRKTALFIKQLTIWCSRLVFILHIFSLLFCSILLFFNWAVCYNIIIVCCFQYLSPTRLSLSSSPVHFICQIQTTTCQRGCRQRSINSVESRPFTIWHLCRP